MSANEGYPEGFPPEDENPNGGGDGDLGGSSEDGGSPDDAGASRETDDAVVAKVAPPGPSVKKVVPIGWVLQDFSNVRIEIGEVDTLAKSIGTRGLLASPLVRPHPRYEETLKNARRSRAKDESKTKKEAQRRAQRARKDLDKARERREAKLARAVDSEREKERKRREKEAEKERKRREKEAAKEAESVASAEADAEAGDAGAPDVADGAAPADDAPSPEEGSTAEANADDTVEADTDGSPDGGNGEVPIDEWFPSDEVLKKKLAREHAAVATAETELADALNAVEIGEGLGEMDDDRFAEAMGIEPLYQLVCGFRRMEAVRLLDWPVVEVEVRRDLSDADVRQVQLAENLERKALSPIETAMGMQRMAEDDRKTRSKIAEELKISRSEVSKHLNLLKLDDSVQMNVHHGELSRTHADVLYRRLKDDKQAQRDFATRAVREKLDVNTLESYVKEHLQLATQPKDTIPEERFLALPPTPTTVLKFRDDILPEEGDEDLATEEQRLLLLRMSVYVMVSNANDHQLRNDELGLPVPYSPDDTQEIIDYTQELDADEAEAIIFRFARRYFEAGHRATRLPPGFIIDHMYTESSDSNVQEMLDAWKAARDAEENEDITGEAEEPEGPPAEPDDEEDLDDGVPPPPDEV